MTDERALLTAIAANPEDDTVRLAYADHLDELGGEVNQARAEYIRLQIYRQQGLDAQDSARESALYIKYNLRWQLHLPAGFIVQMGYRRGFPFRATATASAVLAAIDDPFTRLIEELNLQIDVQMPQFLTLVRHPVFRRLKALRLSGPPSAIHMVVSDEFPRLEQLSLSVRGEELQILCTGNGFPNLRRLDLLGDSIGDNGIDMILKSSSLVGLRVLFLHRRSTDQISQSSLDRLRERFGPGLSVF